MRFEDRTPHVYTHVNGLRSLVPGAECVLAACAVCRVASVRGWGQTGVKGRVTAGHARGLMQYEY